MVSAAVGVMESTRSSNNTFQIGNRRISCFVTNLTNCEGLGSISGAQDAMCQIWHNLDRLEGKMVVWHDQKCDVSVVLNGEIRQRV